MSREQVDSFVNCFKGALKDFEFYSKGKEQSGYSPKELIDFLNQHYLPDNKIEDGLLREIMTIKVLIMGGSNTFISHEEFKRMLECIDAIRTEAIRHLPYIRLYGLHNTLKNERFIASRQTIRDASAALQMTAANLSDRLLTSQASYSMDSLQRFIEELRKFVKWSDIRPNALDSGDLRNVIGSFKEVMLGTTPNAIQPSDWKPLFVTTASLYSLYVEVQTLKRRPSLTEGEGLESVIEFVEHLFTTLQTTLQMQPGNVITFQSMERLIDALGKIDFLPLNVRPASLKPVLHLLVAKVLRDPSLVGANLSNGFTVSALNEARKEFYVWADSQRYIGQIALRKLRSSTPASALSWMKVQTSKDIGYTGLSDEHLTAPMRDLDLAEFFRGNHLGKDHRVYHIEYIVQNVRPMFREGDPRVWLVPPDELGRYNVKLGVSNLSRLNIFGCLIRLLIRGVATPDRALANAGVTESELESFYQTMRPLGSDVKFLDPRSERVGIRSFGEGNMFTFAGNGIQLPTNKPNDTSHLLTFTEGIELLSFIWSGGDVRTRIYDNVASVCGTQNTPDDIFNKRKIERACFFRNFGQNRYRELENLPRMQSYMNRLTPYGKDVFFAALTDIAKIPCEDARFVEKAEIATISTILHYVEGLFTMYDYDKNGKLSATEVLAAFPRFNVFLAKKVKEKTGSDYGVARLKGVFVFLVKNGRIPDTLGDKIGVVWKDLWYFDDDPNQYNVKNPPKAPELSVDRYGLLRVLVMLNKSKASGKVCY